MFAFIFLIAAFFLAWLFIGSVPKWAVFVTAAITGVVFVLLEHADIEFMSWLAMTVHNLGI